MIAVTRATIPHARKTDGKDTTILSLCWVLFNAGPRRADRAHWSSGRLEARMNHVPGYDPLPKLKSRSRISQCRVRNQSNGDLPPGARVQDKPISISNETKAQARGKSGQHVNFT